MEDAAPLARRRLAHGRQPASLMAALSGEVGVPDQDVLEQELEELLR